LSRGGAVMGLRAFVRLMPRVLTPVRNGAPPNGLLEDRVVGLPPGCARLVRAGAHDYHGPDGAPYAAVQAVATAHGLVSRDVRGPYGAYRSTPRSAAGRSLPCQGPEACRRITRFGARAARSAPSRWLRPGRPSVASGPHRPRPPEMPIRPERQAPRRRADQAGAVDPRSGLRRARGSIFFMSLFLA